MLRKIVAFTRPAQASAAIFSDPVRTPTRPPNSTCWDEVDLNHDGTKPSHSLDTCSSLLQNPPNLWGVPYFPSKSRSVRLLSAAPQIWRALDTFKFLRHVMRAILSVRTKCSHRCISPKETPLKPVIIRKHATRISTEQTSMRTKWFKHIAI